MISACAWQIRRATPTTSSRAFQSQHLADQSSARPSLCLQERSSASNNQDLLLHQLCLHGHLQKAVSLLFNLPSPPSVSSYVALLKACSKHRSLPFAKQVHSHLRIRCVNLNGLLGDHLVLTLAKCGAIDDSLTVLRSLAHRTVISWTAIISAYTDAGYGSKALEMYVCMQEDGLNPDAYTYASLLKACGSIPNLEQGKKLHVEARTKGFAFEAFVGNTLVSMYGKCGDLQEAEVVFCELTQRDTVSWNALLSAYVEQGHGNKALQLYRQMQFEGTSSDSRTLMFVLRACSILAKAEFSCHTLQARGLTRGQCLEIGRALHAVTRKRGFSNSLFIGNTLVSLYGKCGMLQEAENVLSMLSRRDVVTWTAVLSACIEEGQGERALHVFKRMQEEDITPDQVTYIMAIQACTNIVEMAESLMLEGKARKAMSLEIGKALHADAHRDGLASCLNLSNALLNLYGKCRAVQQAEEVFKVLNPRDIVSWGAMLSTYIEDGEGDKALWLYQQMQNEHLISNDIVFVCVLQACRLIGSLEICRHVYFELVSNEVDKDPSVAATLIHAYGSCAMMVDAHELFETLPQPDFVMWTACIAGHAEEGNSFAGLAFSDRLNMASIKADDVVFASALSACNNSGMVDDALNIYLSMNCDFSIRANPKHYGILIDTLGRAGNFKKVENLIGRLPMQIDSTIWLGLLGSCSKHGNLQLAEKAFKNAVILQPKEVTAFILMSNIFAEAGLKDSAVEVMDVLEAELKSS